ncbi:MAG: beta strand repeat-containing protein, partial [Spongiibacteraceae bacterium]
LNLNSDGSFTYTPNAYLNGSDSFTYTIADADGDTDTATVNINVTPVDDAPDAVDNSHTVAEDSTLTVAAPGVLGNDDIGGDGGTLAVTSNTNPSNGSLSLNSNGSFTYTPDADFNGSDSFTYTIADADGDTDTATVNINVTPVDDAPDAVDNSHTVAEDGTLTVAAPGVLGNDDIGGDGGTLAVTSNTNPSNGSLSLNSNGSFTYTPDADFNGSDSFTYTIADADGDTDTATVNINVTPVDDAPDAVDNSHTVAEDGTLTVAAPGILGNDDIGGDGGTLTATLGTDVSNGTLTLNSNGSFTYVPDADFNGSDSFTYTIADADGDTDTATVNINVTPVDDAPDAVDNSHTVAEDGTLTVAAPGILGNDDIGGDGGTLAATLATDVSNGSLTLNSDGSFSYTPDENFNGSDSFTYTIADADGDTDTATVNITVTAGDDVPDAVDNSHTVAEDGTLTVAAPGILGNDDIGGDGGTLAATLATDVSNGTLTLNSNGSFTYSPDADFNGSDSFTYTIADADGDTDTATVNINVTPVDDAPDAVDNSHTVAEDGTLTVAAPGILGNDDIGGDGGTLAATLATDVSNGSLTLNSDGSFSYTPNENFNGSDSFTYTIADADGDTDTATVNINVTPENDPPKITADPQNSGDNDVVYEAGLPSIGSGNGPTTLLAEGEFTIADADGLSDIVSVTINTTTIAIGSLVGSTVAGSNGTLTVTAYNPTTGVADYSYTLATTFDTTPDADNGGNKETDKFSLTVSDGDVSSTPASIVIEIVDDIPVAVNDGSLAAPLAIAEDTATVVNAFANDTDGADGVSLTTGIAVTSGPSNGGVSYNNDGTFTYT